jgi:Uma2 family endonuclease
MMPVLRKILAHRRRFRIGTTGWTAADLDDPRIEAEWLKGRYEIVEGVLTRLPAAYDDGGFALKRLIRLVDAQIINSDPEGEIVTEVDLVVGEMRVPTVDGIYLAPSERAAQKLAHAGSPNARPGTKYGRILIAPTLVIESISLGHEAHDRVTKRRWYEEAKIPNYWLLNAYDRSLECLALVGGHYVVDASGRNADEVHPSAFPRLAIPLASLWVE